MNTPTPTAEHVKEAIAAMYPGNDGSLFKGYYSEKPDAIIADIKKRIRRIAETLALRDTRYAAKEAECERLRGHLSWAISHAQDGNVMSQSWIDEALQALTDTLTEQTNA